MQPWTTPAYTELELGMEATGYVNTGESTDGDGGDPQEAQPEPQE